MRDLKRVLATLAALAAVVLQPPAPARAQPNGPALRGRVTSMQEGPMEGVLVGAKRNGSTITVVVVSDAEGVYEFPRERLAPGEYALSIWATGYQLPSLTWVDIGADATQGIDLELRAADNLAAQLSNTEWLLSIPGTDEQKRSFLNCAHCHLLDRPLNTNYNAATLVAVIERMAKYPPLAFPLLPQFRPAERLGPGAGDPNARARQDRALAEYIASINLSTSPERGYALKTLPRPTGKATRVIYTKYDLQPATRQPHDVIVDSDGYAWYASFGEQVLARVDTKTGAVTEWEIPTFKPGLPTGVLGVEFDRDENIWLGMQFQGGVAKFDRKTEKFQTWRLPPGLDGDHVQINQVAPEHSHVDGKVWFQDAGTYTVLRLDTKTGHIESFAPYEIPRPNVYDVISDEQNNGYFTVMGASHVGRIDATTGKIEIFETPTPRSAPRRGMLDREGNVWVGENRGNAVARRPRHSKSGTRRRPTRCRTTSRPTSTGTYGPAASTRTACCGLIRRAASSSNTRCPASPTSAGLTSTTAERARRFGSAPTTRQRSSSSSRSTKPRHGPECAHDLAFSPWLL
jgi:streptogramin lyase